MRAAAIIASLLLGGCTLFDDPPDRSCRTTAQDCFEAQGEFCNPDTKMCEQRPDAAPLEAAEDEELEADCQAVADD